MTVEALDDVLVRASRDGDRSAFGRLYTRYSRMVHAIVLSRVPAGEADDLVQDVFIAALRQLHALRDERAFGGWLATIARTAGTEERWKSRSCRTTSRREARARMTKKMRAARWWPFGHCPRRIARR